MSTQIQRRRGSTVEHSTFTGAVGELTIDTTKKTVVVHDGSTAGGFPLAKESDALNSSDIGVTVQAFDATLLNDADIGVTIQGYDANLPTWPSSVDETEVGYLDGVTSSIQTQIDAKMTPTYTGNVDITGELIADSYNETYSALSGTTPAVNCETGNSFSLTLSGNTTFTFSNPPASGTAYSFSIEIIQDAGASGYTVTWPTSVDFPAATAPTLTATASAVDVFVFTTRDGGTTWYGFTAGQALA